jgi:hypothetical protein
LRGTHWRADGHFDEEGPLQDEHFWPLHFLVIYPLHGAEYSAVPGISAPVFASLLSTRYRLLVTRAERQSHLEEFSAELEARRLSHASRHLTNGVALHLVLRKLGRELDIVIGSRNMYTKPNVPKKSTAACESDTGQSRYQFFCYHDEGEGVAVTPDTACFVASARFQSVKTEEIALVPHEELPDLACVGTQTLFDEFGMVRRIEVVFYFPSQSICSLARALEAQLGRGRDCDVDPLTWVVPTDMFAGTAPCGFSGMLAQNADAPAVLRVVCVGAEYLEGMQRLNDDGMLEVVLQQATRNMVSVCGR